MKQCLALFTAVLIAGCSNQVPRSLKHDERVRISNEVAMEEIVKDASKFQGKAIVKSLACGQPILAPSARTIQQDGKAVIKNRRMECCWEIGVDPISAPDLIWTQQVEVFLTQQEAQRILAISKGRPPGEEAVAPECRGLWLERATVKLQELKHLKKTVREPANLDSYLPVFVYSAAGEAADQTKDSLASK